MDENPPPEGEEFLGDVDPGEPLEARATLAEEPREGFLKRIQNRIHRRVTAVHFLDFSIPLPFTIVGQYVLLVLSLFERPRKSTGDH